MKITLYLLALTWILGSCTTTKIYTKTTCNICLDRSNGILLLPLNWDPSFRKLSIAEQNSLERGILEVLRREGFTKVELYDQMDYELLSAGIQDLNDSTQRAKVNTVVGYPYLIGLTLGEIKDSDGWDYQTPEEANAIYPVYREELEVSATIRLALIETLTGKIVSDNSIKTEINELGSRDDEDGINYWNFGTIQRAVRVATEKGTRHIIKDCGC
jgi:hypothetical protein